MPWDVSPKIPGLWLLILLLKAPSARKTQVQDWTHTVGFNACKATPAIRHSRQAYGVKITHAVRIIHRAIIDHGYNASVESEHVHARKTCHAGNKVLVQRGHASDPLVSINSSTSFSAKFSDLFCCHCSFYRGNRISQFFNKTRIRIEPEETAIHPAAIDPIVHRYPRVYS